VTGAQVPLTAIVNGLQGVIPSPFATCGADGMPNITYMSLVQYVDADRVALSRQFFRKTAANLDENPSAQVLVVDPDTMEQYLLDLRFLHTETEGPVFDTLERNLQALAAQTGAEQAARLRGADIHRVVSCVRLRDIDVASDRGPEADVLKGLDDFVRRMGSPAAEDEGVALALRSLEDIFGFAPAAFLARDGRRLRVVATNGYGRGTSGDEVEIGRGLIGVAAERGEVMCVPNLERSHVMAAAVDDRPGEDAAGASRPIGLPSPGPVHSVAAVPLVLHGATVGVLYLESEKPGAFGQCNERLLRIVGHHLGATVGNAPAAARHREDERAMEITYYQADDSVFADGDYVIKGAPGRILWKLLREHVTEGRVHFTNRELRLDERLELPAGNDNLDSRLVSLRRRLHAGSWGIGLDRVGRGRLALQLERPLTLAEVPTAGPMRRDRAWPPDD
jgi:GAF domain-containing protein